ncbi:MAG: PAS domain-containing protein [Pseudomonadota bacterium]
MHIRFALMILVALSAWFAITTPVQAQQAAPAAAQASAVPTGVFTAEEQAWMAANPVVQLLSDAASPPFDFLDAEGRHAGLFPEYLEALAQVSGLRFEWSAETRRDKLAMAASRGQGQLLMAFAVPVDAALGLLPVQRTVVNDYPVLVVRREGNAFDQGSVAGAEQRVSLVRGYGPAQDYAARMEARQFLNSEGFEPALVDVATGRTDMSVQSLAVAEFLIQQRGLLGLQIAGPYSQSKGGGEGLRWWVSPAAGPLAGILEKSWDLLPPERHRALRARWLDRPIVTAAIEAPLAIQLSPEIRLLTALLLLALLALIWRLYRQRSRPPSPPAAASARAHRVERVMEQSPALVFEMEQGSKGLVVRYASREARQLFAIDMDDDALPIEAFLRTIYPEDQPKVIAAVQRSAAQNIEAEQEYRVLSPQGLRWVKTILRPRPEPGVAMLWSGVTLDITNQKLAEARAEQNDQRLREIADHVPGVAYQLQRDLAGVMKLNFASAALFATRGVRREDFNRDGDAFFNSVHEDDREAVRRMMDASAQTFEPLVMEYRVRMGDGRIEWMNDSATPVRGRDGVVMWNGYISNITRLKTAEIELVSAQQFLRELTDGVPGFIYQMRKDSQQAPYRMTFASAGVSTHGLTPAEVKADANRLYAAINDEDRGRVLVAIDRSFANLSPFRVDYRLRLPSGLTAWMRTQAAPSAGPDGAVQWNGMTFNISEEKLREAQAQRAEERLNRITNALPGVVFQLAATPAGDFVYTYISSSVRNVYQIEPDAVLRDSSMLHQMVFVEDYRRLEVALTESTQSGSEVVQQYRIRRSDGALRWLRTLARPQGHDGESFVWNGFTQDITEEREAGSRADALQQRLREVTENVPCTVFQLQRDFEDDLSVRFVSENIYGLIGISREEVLEDVKSFISRIEPVDLTLMIDSLDTAHREQRPVFFDFRIRDTSKSLRWVRGSVSTPRVEDGGMVWNGAWLDITDIKLLEAELASASQVADGANRLKSEFLATMSHEIRTPMNAIIGLGQLLQQTPLTGSQRSYLDKINTASQSLLAILNDILDHSKIEAGKMSLERTEFDLNTVLDNLSAVTHLKAAEKNLELRFEVPPGLPMRVLGDPLRLGQILLNLTSNAIKFSERGTVVVRLGEVARSDSELRLAIEVCDEGIGLSQAQIEGLFQSFAQADASTTRKYGGTGLGLSIARNLIRLMDGDIEVRSALGAGSVFRFEASLGLSLVPQPRYDLPRDLYGLHALIVDDNIETCTATEGWLRAFGFEVIQVDSGLAALQTLSRMPAKFALVVLDWRMPGLNGLETAERIRKLPLQPQPALMMSTAYVNEELVRQCESVQLKDFLAKPFSPSALFQAVLSSLGRSEAALVTAEVHQPLTGLRVLVADDNELNLEIATAILEAAGASVRLARDGEEVLDKLNSCEFDVALLDLQMPKLDGLEAARRLRVDTRFATLPLVAMTAHAMPEHREASRLAGFDAHLMKPIDRRELFDTLLRYRKVAVPPEGLMDVMDLDIELSGMAEPLAQNEVLIFDRAGALSRLGGNQALLQRLLARFVSDHADGAQQIIAALEAGDSARATREAHTLKGVAANLGATRLSTTAAAVESELRQGAEIAQSLLDQLRIHQQETLRAMQQGSEAASSGAMPDQSRELLREITERLQLLLLAHDADAKDAYESLQGGLNGAATPSMLRLRAAVENYEFEAALLALQELRRDLNLGHGGIGESGRQSG